MKKLLIALAMMEVLAACGGGGGSHQVPVVGPDGQPTGQTVQQPDGPGVGTGAILGGVAGYLLGKSASGGGGGGGGGVTHHTTVVQKKTVIVQQPPRYAPRYTPRPTPSYSRPSFSGGRRGR